MDGGGYCKPNGAKKLVSVTVMSVIHGGKYWVSEPPGISMTKERQILVMMENHLAEKMRGTYEIATDIPENKLIAVKNEVTGCWHRGELLSPIPENSNSKSRVFLVDHGESLKNVKLKHLQPLPEEMQHLPPQAFVVYLYGLIPLTVTVRLENINEKFHYEKSRSWILASESYAQELLEQSTSAYLRGHKTIGNTVHGEIFFNIPGRGLISLNEEMCNQNFAIYSEEEYEKVIKNELDKELCINMEKKALLEAEKLKHENGNPNCAIKSIQHILMEDFMEDYARKKLLRQEKTLRVLDKMRQDVSMRGLQASDDEMREKLRANILSSATKPIGRASLLNSLKEKDSNLSRGRGLPSHSIKREEGPSNASWQLNKGGLSLLDFFDSISSKPVKTMDVLENGNCESSCQNSPQVVPAGFPLIINEIFSKKGENLAVNSQYAVKRGQNSGENKNKKSPLIKRQRLNQGKENFLKGASMNAHISPQVDSSTSSYKTKFSDRKGLPCDSEMADDIAQMVKFNHDSSTFSSTVEELARIHKKSEGTSVTSLGVHEAKIESKEVESEDFTLCKGKVAPLPQESKTPSMFLSQSRSTNRSVCVEASTVSESAENKSKSDSCHVANPTVNTLLRIRRLMSLKGKDGRPEIDDSGLTQPISSSSNGLGPERSGSKHVSPKPRKDKTHVNPLLLLLDTIKKRSKVPAVSNTVAPEYVTAPCDQLDHALSDENNAPKFEANSELGSSKSSPMNGKTKQVDLSNLLESSCFLAQKNQNQSPYYNQVCNVPSPSSVNDCRNPEESLCISKEEPTNHLPPDAIFAAGEWKDVSIFSKEVQRKNSLQPLTTNTKEQSMKKTAGPFEAGRETSPQFTGVMVETLPPGNQKPSQFKPAMSRLVESDTPSCHEGDEFEIEMTGLVPRSSTFAPMHANESQLCQDSKTHENRVSHDDTSHQGTRIPKLNELSTEISNSRAKVLPKAPSISDCPSSESSSKTRFSSSVEQIFQLFHRRKQLHELKKECDKAKPFSEDNQMSDDANMTSKEAQVSGDIGIETFYKEDSEMQLMCDSRDNEMGNKRLSCVDFGINKTEVNNLKGTNVSGEEVSLVNMSSTFTLNGSQGDRSDECVSREMHSLAKSLSKTEAEKNSRVYDVIKSKGLSIQNLSVRLPLFAAQEQSKTMSPPQTPSCLDGKTSMPLVTPHAEKVKEVELQKILEPEAVKPVSVLQKNLPALLSTSLTSDLTSRDCFYTAHRIKMCRVLVRGHLLTQPIQSIAQAPFKDSLHQALSKMGYRDPMRIQTYAWPALMRGHNLIMINPPNSGKTLGYLLPLMSFMLSPDLYAELPLGNGPLVLILCPSWNIVSQVHDYSQWLLKNVDHSPRIIPVYGGLEDEQMIPLVNGCEILITTPKCFLRLLEKGRLITNFDRLCHLVFDEADTMMKKFLPELKEILRECRLILQKRARRAAESNPSGDSESYQVVKFIAAAKTWCPQLESLVKNIIEKPLLCIGSYLEAAVFAQLKPTLHIVGFQEYLKGKEFASTKSETRITEVDNIVLGILSKSLGFKKFVVVCESASAVKRLAPRIVELGADLLVVHELQNHVDIAGIRQTWLRSQLSGALPVLLISDETLSEFNIGDAEHLVHVGIPTNSKTQFGLRFSTLMDNYRDIFAKDSQDKTCSVDIVVDITNPEVEISGLIEFLERLGMSIPPELNAVASKSHLCKEMTRKKDLLLCPSIKSFGECIASTCKYRHTVLPNVDQPSEGMPTNGEIRVKILHVLNASHLTARILEHIKPDGTKVPHPNDYFHIAAGLARHFRNPNNMMLHGTPEVGDVCVVETEHNLYQRAQVEAILPKSSGNIDPVEVSLKLIDEGTTKIAKAYQLLHLPDDYKKYPGQAKELIVCRMMPRDLDPSWSRAASVKVAELLEESANGELDGKEIFGVVVVALGNTLWVDPLECREWLPKQRTSIIHMALRRDLLHFGLAVDNPDHLQKLKKLCENAGLSFPEKDIVPLTPQPMTDEDGDAPEHEEVKSSHDDQSAMICWESMNCDDFFNVNVIAVENPFSFRIQKVSVGVELSCLSEEIQRWVSRVQQTSDSEISTAQKDYEIGSICLGVCPADSSWCRAKVLGVKKSPQSAVNDSNCRPIEDENDIHEAEIILYELFFVDYGDTAKVSTNEMLPIPENLILQLPFQSIECRLMGVMPIRRELECSADVALVEEWDEEASDAFFNLCRERDNVDIYRPLLAKVFGIHGSGAHGGLKHLVVLYDKGDEMMKRIGESLIQEGFAEECQVIVDGDPEDEVCMELESHWLGEGALLPFTHALEDEANHSIVQSEELVPVCHDSSLCPGGLETVPEGNVPSNTLGIGDADDEDDDSSSFEIIMTDNEAKMYKEKLQIFLGIPSRPKEDHENADGLKAITSTSNTAYLDDHSSLASYEIIPNSSTLSVGRIEEITDNDLSGQKMLTYSPGVSDGPKVIEIIDGKIDLDNLNELQGSEEFQMASDSTTISECVDTREYSALQDFGEEQKYLSPDTDDKSFKITSGPAGVDGSQNTKENNLLKCNSCGNDEMEACTSLIMHANDSIQVKQIGVEPIDGGAAVTVSLDIKSEVMPLKSEDEKCDPAACEEEKDIDITKGTDCLVGDKSSQSSEVSEKVKSQSEVQDLDRMRGPQGICNKAPEDSGPKIANTSSPCSIYSEHISNPILCLDEHVTSSKGLEGEFSDVVCGIDCSNSSKISDVKKEIEESCERESSTSDSGFETCELRQASGVSLSIEKSQSNDDQLTANPLSFNSSVKGNLFALEMAELPPESERASLNLEGENQLCHQNKATGDKIGNVGEVAPSITEVPKDRCESEVKFDSLADDSFISDENVNIESHFKSLRECDFSSNDSLRREGIIVFDGESEKTPSGFQDLSDTYEGDVASKSVANDTVASDVSDDIEPCIEPSAECDMLRSESFTSVNENNDSDCVNSNQSGDLSSDTLCSVASDADVVIGSSLSDHPSKHKGDVSQLSVKQLIEDLPQHEAGVLDNEHINTRIDVEENGNNNVDQEENSIHDRCMELKSDTRPPPLVPAKIPLVKWSQSKWEVILTIELPSMKHYSIYWKSNKILNIHASSGTPESKPCFALELPLWASINTEEFVHMPISNNTLKLILPKGFASEDWPRLLSTPNRPLWLSVDFDQLSVDADEDQDLRLNEVAQYMNSDDDDTDSEDEETGAGLRFEEINFDPYDPLD